MRILVVAVCKNGERILPWFLRHYSFADEVHLWINGNRSHKDDSYGECRTYNEHQQGKHPVVMFPYDTGGVLRDDIHSFLKSTHHKLQHGFDYCIAVDMDEFLYHPRGVRTYLQECMDKGIVLPRTQGFSMVGDGFPKYEEYRHDGTRTHLGDSDGLSELVTEGVPDDNYSKYAAFSTKLDIQYGAGCHPHDTRLSGFNPPIRTPTEQGGGIVDWCYAPWYHKFITKDDGEPELKLLHYRWWSEQDAEARASATKLSDYNLKYRLGCDGQTDPNHMRQCYLDAKARRTKVI